MSVLDGIFRAIDDLFIPHDGLYRQAKDLIAQHDQDGDGRIALTDGRADLASQLPGIFGASARGFRVADEQGNDDGTASLREVRTLLKQYDTGQPLVTDSAGDGRIEGAELLRLIGDFSMPRASAAASGATDGVGQLSTP